MADDKRFIRTHKQGGFTSNLMEIWVDAVTGVNYLFTQCGYSGGLTFLLDRDGKPVLSPLPIREED